MQAALGGGLQEGGGLVLAAGVDDSPHGRNTLARWMLGLWEARVDGTLDPGQLESLKEQAWAEGVTVLAGDRLARCPQVPPEVRLLCRGWAREQAAAELGLRARTQAVLAHLDAAGIPVLVLKGAALAHWLYEVPWHRETSDVDLLFASRADAERAGQALAALGYVTPYRAARFRHELLCRSADGLLDLDLHWGLSGWPVFGRLPDFQALSRERVALPGLGPGAWGLGAAHALLHACVHRASNLSAGLGDRLKWLYDLHLLANELDAQGKWPQFAGIARQAQGCGVCVEGLAASGALWGTRVPASVIASLEQARASEPLDTDRLSDWRYLQRLNLQALERRRDKAVWLWSRLLPSAGHLRELYGDGHGYAGLLWQRARRAVSRLVK